MLYEGKNPVLRIISIERLQWAGGAFTVGPREYGALTFRIRGTASITVDGTESEERIEFPDKKTLVLYGSEDAQSDLYPMTLTRTR